MRRIFFDIDTQHYFFDSEFLVQERRNIGYLTDYAVKERYQIVGSVETHDFTSWSFYTNANKSSTGQKQYKKPFCIKGTYDWLKVTEFPEKTLIVPDVNFGLFSFSELLKKPEYAFTQAFYFEKQINLADCYCFNTWMYQQVQQPIVDNQSSDQLEFILYGAHEGLFNWLPGLINWIDNLKSRKTDVKINIVLVKDALDIMESKLEQQLQTTLGLKEPEELTTWLTTNNIELKTTVEVTGKKPSKFTKFKRGTGNVVPIT